MTELIRSPVFGGAWSITQPWGCTDLDVEPFWNACKLEGGHFHCGVYIGLPMNTLLYAARAGVVTEAMVGWIRINVDCGDHSEDDNYLHISATRCRIGDRVSVGQLIGYSGNALISGGSTTGPHLHFEVQLGALNFPGTSKDPIAVLNPAAGAATGQGDIDMATADEIYQELRGSGANSKLDMIMAKLGLPSADVVDKDTLDAAIADLKAHPAVVSDPSVLAIVSRLEAALKTA